MPDRVTGIVEPSVVGQFTSRADQVARETNACDTRPSGSSASLAAISPQKRPSRLDVRGPASAMNASPLIVKRFSASVSQTNRVGCRCAADGLPSSAMSCGATASGGSLACPLGCGGTRVIAVIASAMGERSSKSCCVTSPTGSGVIFCQFAGKKASTMVSAPLPTLSVSIPSPRSLSDALLSMWRKASAVA